MSRQSGQSHQPRLAGSQDFPNSPVSASPQSAWKVALVHPTYWPFVRRGTERFINEFATYLTRNGHHVTILTSKPGRHETEIQQQVRVEYLRALWRPWMASAGLLDFHVFPLTVLPRLLSRSFHLIHTFNFVDTLAACLTRNFTRTPVLLHLNTIPPTVRYRRSLSTGGNLLRCALKAADEILMISREQEEYFGNRFGCQGIRLPAPINTHLYRSGGTGRNRSAPLLLCASALDDRRKGGRALMRAFNLVKQNRPEVRLEIYYPLSAALRNELLNLVEPQLRNDVSFLREGEPVELADRYAQASLLVLPSLWEAFPLVVLESLASGTPVVGSHHGGILEIIYDRGEGPVGITFDPGEPEDAGPSNIQGLAEAILAGLQLSIEPSISERCRAAAAPFDWEALGPRYLELYTNLIAKAARHESSTI
jgi:glycosyltransferase involved in cell wall biosynthesis